MTTVNYYGTTLTKAVSKDIQAQTKKTYGLNFPFGINTKRGYFAKEAGAALIRSNIKQLLNTIPGERVMLPNFGIDLRKYLFEPLDSVTFSEMRDEIFFTLNKYAPFLRVVALRITESEKLNYTGIPGIVVQLTVQIKNDQNQILDVSINIGE
jgi:phage baseplate assembly protein W